LSLNDVDTALLTKLERDFISKIGAGCSVPVAVNATLNGDIVKIEAMVGFPDGTEIIHHTIEKERGEAQSRGER